MSDLLRKPKINTVKLGDLLVAADILAPADLERAIHLAQQSMQPLGRVLLKHQFVKETDLDSALSAQAMVGDGTLSASMAIKALGRASRSFVSIEDALDEIGWRPPVRQYSDLGDLLVDAQCLNRAHCQDAITEAQNERLLLGRYLVFKSVITNSLLHAALESLVLLREETITREQAIAVVAHLKGNPGNFASAADELGISRHMLEDRKLTLGDILTGGGVITDVDRLEAVERSITEQQLLGAILVGGGLITQEALESALSLQSMARTGALEKGEACEVLRQSQHSKKPIKQILESRPRDGYKSLETKLELLKAGGIVREENIPQGQAFAARTGLDVLQGLVATGLLSRYIYQALDDCLAQMAAGALSKEQGIMALFWCERGRCGLTEAITEMNRTPTPKAPSIEVPTVAADQKTSVSLKKPGTSEQWQEGMSQQTSSIAFRHGVFALSLYAAAGCLTMAFAPNDYKLNWFWGIIAVAAIDLLRRGYFIEQKRKAEKDAYMARVLSAKDIHGRTQQLQVRKAKD